MNKFLQNFALKGIGLLVFTFIVLYFIYLQDLTHSLFFALYNTAIIGLFGLIFLGVTWKKLENFEKISCNKNKNLVIIAIGLIFLIARYFFIEVPFRGVLTALGLLLVYKGIFGYELIKQFFKQYKKEVVISVVIFIVIVAILVVTNIQYFIRTSLGL